MSPLSSARQVNAPIFEGEIWEGGAGLVWFGQVTSTNNYADARVAYNESELFVKANIFDRRLWYDTNPSQSTLTAWDSASLFVNLSGNAGSAPDNHSYKFIVQLKSARAGYQGNGTGWQSSAVPFTTETSWRGNGPNDDADDNGWVATFHIPFSSLGLAGPPAQGTIWGLGMIVNDRDDASGTAIPAQKWPETLNANRPDSWGQVYFGEMPAYTAPSTSSRSTTLIRNGLYGVQVKDGEVGGHTVCGQGLDIWTQWGTENYSTQTQINIQNQLDVSDWPCFSKYYISFPPGSIPANKVIVSATLTMYQFGNSGQGWDPPPFPSLIQVLSTGDDWNESTINWNNAPLPVKYITAATVNPLDSVPPWPGIPVSWDVSSAMVDAYKNGRPLQLVLYSADIPMHSGKYFYSSKADPEGRPVLRVVWGDP